MGLRRLSSSFVGKARAEHVGSSINDLYKQRSSPESDGVNINTWFAQKVRGIGNGSVYRDPSIETAWQIPAVYAIIKIIAEDIASLPHDLHRRTPEGNSIVDFEHPVSRMLRAPNHLFTNFTLKETLVCGLLTRGNAFAKIHFDKRGNAGELEYLRHEDVTVDYDYFLRKGELFYHISDTSLPLMPHEILHYKGLSQNGIEGVSPLSLLNSTIHDSLRSQDLDLEFKDNGARVRNVLSTPNKLSDEAYENLKGSFTTNHMGPQADPTLILEEGLTFSPVSLSPQDAQLLMSRKFNLEEISRPFRIPLHMLNNLEKATYSNVEHQSLEYVKFCLRPNVTRLEAEENRKLLKGREQNKRFFKYNLDDILRADTKARAEYLKIMFQNGLKTQNEIRAINNDPPLDGGNVLMTPVNMRDKLTEPLGGNVVTDKDKKDEEE